MIALRYSLCLLPVGASVALVIAIASLLHGAALPHFQP